MRRMVTILLAEAFLLVVASGVAVAAVRSGGTGDDRLHGGSGRDRVSCGGNDFASVDDLGLVAPVS